jgi:hypothetical protein
MAKWADYLVSKVKYSNKPKRVISFKVHKFTGDSVGKEEVWTRSKVIEFMDKNETFYTIFKNPNGRMDKGPQVKKVIINNADYLRTDDNKTEEDDLGKLPLF